MTTQISPHYGKFLLAVSIEPVEIGKRIKAAREDRGWTQLELAAEASVSPSSVQRWEGGKLPPVRELMRLADVLGVEADQFVEPAPNGRDDLADLRSELAALHEDVRELLRRAQDDAA